MTWAPEGRILTVTLHSAGPREGLRQCGPISRTQKGVDGVFGGLEQGQGGPGSHHLPESEGDMVGGLVPLFSLCFCSL